MRLTFLYLLACSCVGAQSSANAEAVALATRPMEASSRTLATTVLHKLQRDSIVDASTIDVAEVDGIVTLTGNQRLLLACDRAGYIAETVPGVRGVINRLRVRQAREADTQKLESDVLYMLLTDPATEHSKIAVSANASGRVTLAGMVSSYSERILAGQVVRSVVGVTAVRNDIEIASARPLRDRQMVADVRQMLAWDAYVDSREIDVSAEQGVVTLRGRIDSAAQKRRSIALSWLAGARDVNATMLQVASAPSAGSAGDSRVMSMIASDENIAAAINRSLRADSRLRGAEIQVAVSDRVATLEGAVATLMAKRVAEALVSGLRGVASIDNRLHVAAADRVFSDAEIESRIERSLARNSLTRDDAIGVSVVDAAVTLEGDAHNWLSRQLAENAAASIRGVHAVNNDIVVAEGTGTRSFNPYVDAGPIAWTND